MSLMLCTYRWQSGRSLANKANATKHIIGAKSFDCMFCLYLRGEDGRQDRIGTGEMKRIQGVADYTHIHTCR